MKKYFLFALLVTVGVVAIILLPINRVTFDLTWLMVCLTAICVVGLLNKLLSHVLAPKREFIIETSFNIQDPMIPILGRHTFRAEIIVKESKKGEWRLVNKRTVELAVRPNSRQEFQTQCMDLVRTTLGQERAAAMQLDPKARIVVVDPEPELQWLISTR